MFLAETILVSLRIELVYRQTYPVKVKYTIKFPQKNNNTCKLFFHSPLILCHFRAN